MITEMFGGDAWVSISGSHTNSRSGGGVSLVQVLMLPSPGLQGDAASHCCWRVCSHRHGYRMCSKGKAVPFIALPFPNPGGSMLLIAYAKENQACSSLATASLSAHPWMPVPATGHSCCSPTTPGASGLLCAVCRCLGRQAPHGDKLHFGISK